MAALASASCARPKTAAISASFRSDHFTNPVGEDKDSLELWISLAYAASHTEAIEFGPLVAPITFRHPSMNARYAAAIDDLSGGRLIFGLGAGWQDREHRKFGIAFHDFATRFRMLEEALEVSTRLLKSDAPSDYSRRALSSWQTPSCCRGRRARAARPFSSAATDPKRPCPWRPDTLMSGTPFTSM